MSDTINLTSIFGDEIIVSPGAYIVERQYSSFAGAEGLTSMNLGGRGYPLIVKGTIRSHSSNYSSGRGSVANKFTDILYCLYDVARDYTFKGEFFGDVVWDKVEPVRDARGQVYHQTSTDVIMFFIAYGRALS